MYYPSSDRADFHREVHVDDGLPRISVYLEQAERHLTEIEVDDHSHQLTVWGDSERAQAEAFTEVDGRGI